MKDKLSRPYSLEDMAKVARKVAKVYYNPYTGKTMNFKNPMQMNAVIQSIKENIENDREYLINFIIKLVAVCAQRELLEEIRRKRQLTLATLWIILATVVLWMVTLKIY